MSAPVIQNLAGFGAVTGGTQNITLGAGGSLAAGDIIVITAQAHNTSGTVATSFGWPAGFTQLFALNCKTSAGVARGLYGVAWKRAVGTEGGTIVAVTHNGATGAATFFGLAAFAAYGCETSGNPYDQYVTNNPNFSTTIDYPAITTTGTEKSLLTGLLNSDNNANAATATNWTTLLSGNNGTGCDGGNDIDKRENVAAGTYDPANVTVANTNAIGWVTFQIEFKPATPKQTGVAKISLAAGATPDTRTNHILYVRARVTLASAGAKIKAALYEGAINRSGDLEDSVVNVLVDKALAIPDVGAAAITDYSNLEVWIWGYTSDGSVRTFEVDQVWLQTPAGPSGPTTHYGSTSMAITFGKAVSGQRKTFGQIDRPFTFAAVVAGKVTQTHFGALALPMIFGKDVRGQRKVFGQLALPLIFSKDVQAQRKTFGQVIAPLTFGKAVAGQRKAFGQIAFPITVGIATSGIRVGLTQYGVVSLPVIFGKDVRGQRKTFGQLLSPFLFSKDVRGQRKTFGQIAFPITIGLTVAGTRVGLTKYGIVALPMIFGKDVRGQRKAFGQISLPLAFSKQVQARRTTFGQISLPIIFTKEAVGRKNVFGQLSMQTLFGKEIAGRRKTFSQLAMPIIFSKAVVGRKQTFGKVALPINVPIYVAGYGFVGPKTYYGQLALPVTFGKQVAARRKTFGQITAPLLFGSVSQGQRRTFSEFELPIDFETAVKSGPVGAHGQIALPIVIGFTIAGKIIIAGIILNEALDLHLGDQDILAAYVGSEQVWP